MCVAAYFRQHAQHGTGPYDDLDPEFHCQGIRSVLIKSLAHGRDHATNRLGEFR